MFHHHEKGARHVCIMEVRVGQHSSTIAQACAHNVGTVKGDLELFARLLESRDPAMVTAVQAWHAKLDEVYEEGLRLYGEFVAHEHPHLASYAGEEGAERSSLDVAAAAVRAIEETDRRRAAVYETRR